MAEESKPQFASVLETSIASYLFHPLSKIFPTCLPSVYFDVLKYFFPQHLGSVAGPLNPLSPVFPYNFFDNKVNIFISNNLEKLIRIIQSKEEISHRLEMLLELCRKDTQEKGYILNANVIHCSHKLLFNHAKSEIQKEKKS